MILWDIIVGSRMSYKANVSYPELSPISRKLLLHFTVERIKFLVCYLRVNSKCYDTNRKRNAQEATTKRHHKARLTSGLRMLRNLSQSRRLPLLQVVSNNKPFSVGVQSPTEINAPRGCAVILRRICQLSLTRITHQVSRAFDLNS